MNAKLLFFFFVLTLSPLFAAAPVREMDGRHLAKMNSGQHPLLWTGNWEPSDQDVAEVLALAHSAAGPSRDKVGNIEAYLEKNPNSPFAAALHSIAALENRRLGRYTAALGHWNSAGTMVRSDDVGNGKAIFDFTLVHHASLLASLGRTDELAPLVRNYQFRVMAQPHWAEMWARTIEAFFVLRRNPGIAYRCGTYALNNVSQMLNQKPFAAFREYASTTNGFSLAELQLLSDRHQLGLVAAVRDSGAELISPAVIHWKQNHYAAIKRREGKRLLVVDPTFLSSVWMDASTIEEEASGYFLVPRAIQLPTGWRYASAEESGLVFGKGYPQKLNDSGGSGCTECCRPKGASGTGGDEDPCGMATWSVQEPHINLTVTDIPFAYKAAFGPDFVVNLTWRARNSVGPMPFAGFSDAWESDLVSAVQCPEAPTSDEITIELRLGDGTIYEIPFDQGATNSNPDYLRAIRATRTIVSNTVTEFHVYYQNGSVDYYTPRSNGDTYYLLRWRKDATGQAVEFTYDSPAGIPDRLTKVKLADGAEFNFAYTNENPWYNVITEITGPNGRSAKFHYLEYPSGGSSVLLLTNITDAEGISSSFVYDPDNRWRITSMTTPYGTTGFDLFSPADSSSCPNGEDLTCDGIDRSLVITEPDGGKRLYLFYDNDYGVTFNVDLTPYTVTNAMVGKIPNAFSALQIPATNEPPIQRLDTLRDKRNSHYWGRQQTMLLSITNNFTFTNLANLTSNDYKLSRTRHWLAEKMIPDKAGQIRTLGWELHGSQDGVIEGLPVFRDYLRSEGSENWHEGTSDFPSLISQRMPDGTTRYTYFARNTSGMVTTQIESWGQLHGTNQTRFSRTNTFEYASSTNQAVNGLLLLKAIGPEGNIVVGRTLHANGDQIGTETNAAGNHTIFDYDSFRRLVKREAESGLISIYDYYPTNHASGSLRLKQIVDYLGNTNSPLRTNTFTWSTGYVDTITDARGFQRNLDFDLLGRIRTISYPVDGGTNVTTERFEYFLPPTNGFNSSTTTNLPILDLVTYKDRLGNMTRLIPNRVRQVEQIFEPSKTNTGYFGTEHRIDYCGCGSPKAIIRGWNTPNPEIVTFEYNSQGAPIVISLTNMVSITNRYDLLRRLEVREDAFTKVTNRFDNLNRLVERRNAAGLLVGLGYDADDDVIAWTNSAGVLVTNQYDGAGRILARGHADGGVEKWRYDTNGFFGPVNYTNQLGNATTWAFDAIQRLTNETAGGVFTNRFNYSPADDLLGLADGKNQVTSWTYDAEGRVRSKVNYASIVVLTNGYNANAQLTASWTPAKQLTSYFYDGVGNLTNVTPQNSPHVTFAYDELNRLVTMVDGVGTNRFSYNPTGQLAAEDGPWASDTVVYGYTAGRRTSLTLAQPYSSPWVQWYGYDSAGRLEELTSPAGYFEYLFGGGSSASPLIKKLTFPNETYLTNTYDSVARLASTVLIDSANTPLNSHVYLVNQGNQRYKQTFKDGNFLDYTYDEVGQLQSATGKELGGGAMRMHEKIGYKYDASGNLLVRTNGGLQHTFNVNVLNQISNVTHLGNITVAGFTTTNSSVTVNGNSAVVYADLTFARTNLSISTNYTAIATDGAGRGDTNTITVSLPSTVSHTYDQNGNLTSDGLRGFGYDDNNQLTSVGANDWETQFVYDGLMRKRVAQHYRADMNSAGAFVTGATSLSSLLRNDSDAWVGAKITVGTVPLVLTELGRWVISGNSQSHTVRLAHSDGSDVPGGSVSVNTFGAPTNQFKYAALATPVRLLANTTYYIVSREFNGGDKWYSFDNVLTTTSVASINNMAYTSAAAPNTFVNGSHVGGMWGPLSFRYTTAWNLTREIRYIYDGMLPIQERDGNNIPRITHTRGLDLSGTLQRAGGIGGLLARTDHSTPEPTHSFYHADGSGNVTMLIDQNGLPVARYHYDPFGNMLAISGPLADANTYRFSSKELVSGVYYYGHRFYEPNLQRWLNQDPIGELGGVNLYRFVRNSVPNRIDPFGEDCKNLFADALVWMGVTMEVVKSWFGEEIKIPNPRDLFPDKTLEEERWKTGNDADSARTKGRKTPAGGAAPEPATTKLPPPTSIHKVLQDNPITTKDLLPLTRERPIRNPARIPLMGVTSLISQAISAIGEDLDIWWDGYLNNKSYEEQWKEKYRNEEILNLDIFGYQQQIKNPYCKIES
jgi:RHS repeat-associated protein